MKSDAFFEMEEEALFKEMAKLDAASKLTKTYPYWHQEEFVERNPLPV